MLRPAEPGVRLRARRVAQQRQERHQHRRRVGAGRLGQGDGNLAGQAVQRGRGQLGAQERGKRRDFFGDAHAATSLRVTGQPADRESHQHVQA